MRIILALCLVAYASASSCCSAGDMQKVRDSWNSLWNNADASTTKVIFGREVFNRYFEKFPESVDMFKNVGVDDRDSAAFSCHMLRVLNGLDLLVNLLGEDDALEAEIEHLNHQHLQYDGMKAAYLWSMVDILTEALPSVLDDYDALSFKNCLVYIYTDYTKGLP